MVCKFFFFFSGIRTTFEANTIPYHNEDIPGYILRYGVPFCPWVALIHIFTPHCRLPGRVAQSVTCLATDVSLTADPGVASSIPAWSHTFVEIDHEIISAVILLLPLIYSRRVVVSYKRKYVHKLLVNRLLKPAQEKVWVSELTVPQ